MKPEDSHIFCFNCLGDGKYELFAEYQGFHFRPIEGTVVVHDPPIREGTSPTLKFSLLWSLMQHEKESS